MRFAGVAVAAALFAAPAFGAHSPSARAVLDTALIEQLTGAKGQLSEKEGVFKVSVPRSDLDLTAAETPTADIDPAQTSLDPSRIEAALGVKGTLAQSVYKVTIGRTTRMHGADAGNATNLNTLAAFAGSDDRAVVDGDFAMLEGELQPVLKALRGAGIAIAAIRQHVTGEQPRILFLHYWGIGTTEERARGLRAALDRTATRLGVR